MPNTKTFPLFLTIEGCFYILILLMDLQFIPLATSSAPIKYCAVLLCLASVLLFSVYANALIPSTLTLALLSAVIADYFLLFTEQYLPGIILFFFVQLFLCIYLNVKIGPFLIKGLIGIIVYILFSAILSLPVNLLILSCVFYFSCMISNCITAFQNNQQLAGTMIVCLILCDIHVGLANLPRFLSFFSFGSPYRFCYLASNLIWLFYLPGVLLLSLLAYQDASN